MPNPMDETREFLLGLMIHGEPGRKSNSRRIVINQKTGKPMIIKSEKAMDYAETFASQITGDQKRMLGSLDRSLVLYVIVYYRSRRPDLSVELIMDLLEKNEVIANDRYIRETHAYGFVDKVDPRVEILLYADQERREPPYQVQG